MIRGYSTIVQRPPHIVVIFDARHVGEHMRWWLGEQKSDAGLRATDLGVPKHRAPGFPSWRAHVDIELARLGEPAKPVRNPRGRIELAMCGRAQAKDRR